MPQHSLTNTPDTPIMQVNQLEVFINNKLICKDLNFEIKPGEIWGILGVNGAGKTTLLHSIAGLRPVKSGQVMLNGIPLSQQTRRNIAKQLGVLLQNNTQAFPSTVMETVLTGRHPYLHSWQWESPEDIKIAKQALTQVGLESMATRLTNTLSGGEFRRLSLAALIAQNPLMYLLDEPTNHLDLHYQIYVLNLLKTIITTQNKSAVMILHDLNLLHRYCDNCILLFPDSEIITGATDDVLNDKSLTRLLKHPTRKIETPAGITFLPE